MWGMSSKNFLNAIAYCLFPLLLYYVVYEAAGYVLVLAAASVASSGWDRAALWTAAHAGDVSAMTGAAAMAAGFLAIHRTAAQEAPLTRRGYLQRQREEETQRQREGEAHAEGEDAQTGKAEPSQAAGEDVQTGVDPFGRVGPAGAAAAVFLALSSALFLNLVISMSGASAADAGASSAAAQTAAVSLPLGLLYYGILSPFIEETVFRGITFGRIRSVLRAESAGKDAEVRRVQSAGNAAQEEPAQSARNAALEESAQGAAHASAQIAQERRYCIAAAVLSSLLFGIYHGNVVQGFYAFCMGIIFCVFRELTGSLAAAALLHGAVNAMTLLLSQSGVYAQLCTPAWLAASLAIAVCSAIFLAGRSRRRKQAQ